MAYDSYIICTSPRSGSTLLCRLLRQTGVAGYPESHFHEPSVDAWLGYYDLRREDGACERDLLKAIFTAAIASGTRASGMFGLRMQCHSFPFFSRQLAILHPDLPDDSHRIAAAFGDTAFIHLTRTDKLAQAISYVRAEQTGLWHRSSDGSELERLSPPQPPAYDGEKIRAHLDQFTADDAAWRAWFGREGITPFRITYEALAAAPRAILTDTLEHLDLDPGAAAGIVLDVARLADSTNRDWAKRYRAELRS